jgi:hypothetical protein
MKLLLIVLLSLTCEMALAQSPRSQSNQAPVLEELRWVDNGYLERQRALIDEIGRSEFGSRVRKDISDLRLLQRIIDQGLINQTQKQHLQAMGVVLGDVYVSELGLEWRVYKDELGKSRAVCQPKTSHCLFPITMISKRASLGVKPDIRALYDKGVSNIADHIPKIPYSAPAQDKNAR